MNQAVKKFLWRLLQVIIIGLVFYFLGKQIYANWDRVSEFQWEINYFWLICSFISIIATFFAFSCVWKIFVGTLGRDIRYLAAFKIAYLSNLGRYIPGKIWQMFGTIYLAKKEGITEEEAITVFALSQVFAIPSCFLSGILFLGVYPQIYNKYSFTSLLTSGIIAIGLVVFAISLAIVFFPNPIEKIVNRLLKLLKRRSIKLGMNKSLAATIYGGYFLAWSMYGFSFWLFLKGITTQEALLFPMAGIFIIAYQIGYLMLFAPGGVGPREAMMEIMLAPFFGTGVAAAIAIAARLWLITAEAISALIALTIKSSEKTNGKIENN
ncbi:MAG: lysylphosphatidylglycerol synthase transmembrane domain-containing protein [candidate division Zixibacteria bacterium]